MIVVFTFIKLKKSIFSTFPYEHLTKNLNFRPNRTDK
jgi:hypothetical protein